MCLGIPGKVVELKDMKALVDVGGTRREASVMLLDDVKVGEYVIVHAGFAIQKVDEAEAEKTLRIIDELVSNMQQESGER